MLPNFFIIGANKSGTSSLYYYIKNHPEIHMSKIKEPMYFIFNEKPLRSINNIYGESSVYNMDQYLPLFESDKKIKGEASTAYLAVKGTAENIKNVIPNAKITAILRNPIERAHAGYRMHVRDNFETSDFETCIQEELNYIPAKQGFERNYIKLGFYYDILKEYFDIFDHVKVYLFEELKNNSGQLVSNLFEFLDVNPLYIPQNLGVKYNKSPESTISFYAAKKLRNLYGDDIEKLQVLIGKDLTQWLDISHYSRQSKRSF